MNTDYREADEETRTYLKENENSGNTNDSLNNIENITKNTEVSGIFKVLGSTIHFDNSDGFEFVIEALKIK